jgi:hypothetical protein
MSTGTPSYPTVTWAPTPAELTASIEAAIAFIRAADPAAFYQLAGITATGAVTPSHAAVYGIMQVHVQTLLLGLAARGATVPVPALYPKVPATPDPQAEAARRARDEEEYALLAEFEAATRADYPDHPNYHRG